MKRILQLAALAGLVGCLGCAGFLNREYAEQEIKFNKQVVTPAVECWLENGEWSANPILADQQKKSVTDYCGEMAALRSKVARDGQ